MNFIDELDEFFDDDEHAFTGTVDGEPLQGIYTRAFYESLQGEVGTGSTEPRVVVRSSDAVAINGKTLVVPGNGSFKIINQEPDGTGLSELILHKL